MNIDDYQAWVASVWSGSKKPPWTKDDDFVMTSGLPGEAGEVTELLKKAVRDKKDIEKVNKKELAKELGDVLYYVMMNAHRHGIKGSDIIKINMKKITRRHKARDKKLHT